MALVGAPRSKLFIPGDRIDLLGPAVDSGADAVSFDLEDAVAEDAKAAARAAVAHTLIGSRLAKQVWVRVNSADSGHLVADLLALAGAHVDVINLPKAESASEVEFVQRLLEHIESLAGRERPVAIVPTIESPRGLRNAVDIASASPRVLALQLGAGDMARLTGIEPRGAGMDTVRTMLCLAAAQAGVPALDSTPHSVEDAAAFEADARHARSLGFRGKSCMRAAHVAIANAVFSDSARAA